MRMNSINYSNNNNRRNRSKPTRVTTNSSVKKLIKNTPKGGRYDR